MVHDNFYFMDNLITLTVLCDYRQMFDGLSGQSSWTQLSNESNRGCTCFVMKKLIVHKKCI